MPSHCEDGLRMSSVWKCMHVNVRANVGAQNWLLCTEGCKDNMCNGCVHNTMFCVCMHLFLTVLSLWQDYLRSKGCDGTIRNDYGLTCFEGLEPVSK